MTKPYNCEEQVVEPLSEGKLRVQMASQEDEFVRSLVIRNPPMKPNEVKDFLNRWIEQGKKTEVEPCADIYCDKPFDTLLIPYGEGKAILALRTGQPAEDGGIRYDRKVINIDSEEYAKLKDDLCLCISLGHVKDIETPDKLGVFTEKGKIDFIPFTRVAAIAPFVEKVAERINDEKPATSVARLSPIAGAIGKCFPTEEA